MTERGVLIALEGIDGSGKSTQATRLVEGLRSAGYDAVTFREPGDSEYGRELRRIFVEGREVSPEEEVQLFLEDRRIDVRDNIVPALEAGKTVIMDRYYLSSVVYQGCLGVDRKEILRRNLEIAPRPDLTILLEIPVEVARERIEAGRGSTNTFEEASYLEQVRAAYHEFVAAGDMVVVDAHTAPDAVAAALQECVLEFLASR